MANEIPADVKLEITDGREFYKDGLKLIIVEKKEVLVEGKPVVLESTKREIPSGDYIAHLQREIDNADIEMNELQDKINKLQYELQRAQAAVDLVGNEEVVVTP